MNQNLVLYILPGQDSRGQGALDQGTLLCLE